MGCQIYCLRLCARPRASCAPALFRYTSVQSAIYHIIRYAQPSQLDDSMYNTRTNEYDIANYLYYSKAYENTATDFSGDKEFAASVSSYDIMDHGGYFSIDGLAGCGFDRGDSFLRVSTVAELFFM